MIQLDLFEYAGMDFNGHTPKTITFPEIMKLYYEELKKVNLERTYSYGGRNTEITAEHFLSVLEERLK